MDSRPAQFLLPLHHTQMPVLDRVGVLQLILGTSSQKGSRGTLAPFPHMHCHQLRGTPQFHCHHTLFDYILPSGVGMNTIGAVRTTVSPYVSRGTVPEAPDNRRAGISRVSGNPHHLIEGNTPIVGVAPAQHAGCTTPASISHSCMNHRNRGSLLLYHSMQY